MSSTMLELVTQVTNELGVSTPTSVAGNPNQDIIQILALMNAAGYEFLRKHEWRELTKRHTFTTSFTVTTGDVALNTYTITNIPSTAGLDTTYQVVGNGLSNATYVESVDSATQVTVNLPSTGNYIGTQITFEKTKYDLPADYSSTVPRTHWDLSKHWEMLGPSSPQQWEWLLSGFISTGPRIRWRLFGKYFQIWPGVSTNELLGFEYRSVSWALSAANAPKTSFTVDTDTCLYPDRLMVLATKLKYFEAKGFDTTAMYRNYLEEFQAVMAQDMSSANLSFAPRPGTVLIGYDNIPDTGYGVN
tara:strand:+ start:1839 stop:2747 length:909 start_codon:yes stop_codon:yes gene_type:complete